MAVLGTISSPLIKLALALQRVSHCCPQLHFKPADQASLGLAECEALLSLAPFQSH